VAVPRYIDLEANATTRALDAAVSELNGRESLHWANIKISTDGYQDDGALFGTLDTVLGTDYVWGAGSPTTAGGSLSFRNTTIALSRAVSTATRPGVWRRP
jgi:hypothetical protein